MEFYLKYLADDRPERLPQTKPMCAGSAFDAYVKSHLHWKIYGNYGEKDGYKKENIFEMQVEPQNRDFGRMAGEELFKRYIQCGALSDIMIELGLALTPPKFEFEIQDYITTSVGNIPLMGKPDLYYTSRRGMRIIYDWKVNGFCSQSAISPAAGYIRCRDTWSPLEHKPTRGNGCPHPKCSIIEQDGLRINGQMYLEDANAEWATQLGIYGWMLGEAIGSEQMVVGIDQFCGCGVTEFGKAPRLRLANHRTRVSQGHQLLLVERLKDLWDRINSGHFFSNMTREENDKTCAELEKQATALASTDSFAKFVNETSRDA